MTSPACCAALSFFAFWYRVSPEDVIPPWIRCLLSRIQFGLTISFHYIYPPLSIGLGVMLVIMEGL